MDFDEIIYGCSSGVNWRYIYTFLSGSGDAGLFSSKK